MNHDTLARRAFMKGAGAVFGSAIVRAGAPAVAAATQAACSAKEAGAVFETLTDAEAREIIAFAARIIPTTDTPGATEAGAVYFFDKALGSFFAHYLEAGRMALAEFQKGVPAAFPGAELFSDLDEAEQDAYLRTQEESQFFQGARQLTIFGVFAMAKYGGNRDAIGWKLVGMDGPPHAWSYPFGYYDAEYMQEQQGGE